MISTDENISTNSVTLKPNQLEHFNNIIEIIHNKGFKSYLDCSDTGTGKTYVTCIVAKELNMDLAVFAPKNTHEKWKYVSSLVLENTNCNLQLCITESALRGTGKKITQHNLLTFDPETKQFHPTEILSQVQNVLFVFDKADRLRNPESLTSKAISTIARNIPESCRIALLSAITLDKNSKRKVYYLVLELFNTIKFSNMIIQIMNTFNLEVKIL